MTSTILLLAMLAKAPAAATVTTGSSATSKNACEYTSDDPAKKGLVYCTHVATEEACRVEAARKVSPAWLEQHPAKYSPGIDCKASDKKLVAAEKKKQAEKKKAAEKQKQAENKAAEKQKRAADAEKKAAEKQAAAAPAKP
jgi:hypothetical protein